MNGEAVFTALLSVTNEKGEIRSCNLVATKAHSQFELALHRMQHSLELYGHRSPVIFYTDNPNDRQFLEKCFPLLREGVIAVEKYPDLEPLTLPSAVQVQVHNSITAINNVMRAILEDLSHHGPEAQIAVGFDSEWNVEVTGNGNVFQRDKTAIVQIAYKDQIYILQVM